MTTLKHKDLLDAGVHFGHLTRKWNPNMAPFIFMERNGIHIIDLNKTLLQLQEASQALQALAKTGKRILFVATKKQAKAIVEQEAKRLGMPYMTERWLGGTLTNFATIRRLIKKMTSFDKLMKDAAYKNLAKKEQLMIAREKAKLQRLLEGIADTTRLPAALVVVDIKREHIAVKEAQKLGIPVFALADTNTDPNLVDYPIPSNDDASRAVELMIKAIGSAIEDGLAERKKQTSDESGEQQEAAPKRERNVQKIASSTEETPASEVKEAPKESAAVKATVKKAAAPKTAKKAPAKEKEEKKAAPKKASKKEDEKVATKKTTPVAKEEKKAKKE